MSAGPGPQGPPGSAQRPVKCSGPLGYWPEQRLHTLNLTPVCLEPHSCVPYSTPLSQAFLLLRTRDDMLTGAQSPGPSRVSADPESWLLGVLLTCLLSTQP